MLMLGTYLLLSSKESRSSTLSTFPFYAYLPLLLLLLWVILLGLRVQIHLYGKVSRNNR